VSFASIPWWAVAGLGAGILAVVVGLYLLRRTPRPQLVSNVDFWVEALQQARPKVLRSTRIPLLSLILSALVALLLVTEIGGPRFGEGVRGTTVVVLAAGRSMGAEEMGSSRADRALDEVRGWVDRATTNGRVAVVRAGLRPTVLMPLTDDDADLTRALSDFELDDGPADLDAAAELADAIVQREGGDGQILVVADRAPEASTGTPLVLVPVGAPADSLAISALTARRDPIAVGEYAVLCEVRSLTSRRGRARLVIHDRDVVIFDQRFEIGPMEQRRFRAQGFSSAQGELTARLEEIEIAGSEDASTADDVAYAVAPPLESTRVLLATEGNRWLETALAAHGAVEVERASPGDLASMDAYALNAHDVVIADRAAVGEVPHRGVLLIAPPEPARGVGVGEALDGPRVTASLASHHALGGVRLDSIRIARARALEVDPSDHVLLRSGAHALAVAREQGGQRTVALGFGLDDTDLVERVAFPLVLHHTMGWLAGRRGGHWLSRAPGEPLPAPAGATVLGPDDEPTTPTAGWVDDTHRAGIYHLGERAVAYSAASTVAPLPAAAPRAAPSEATGLPPLLVLLAGAMLLLLTLEWVLLHRGRLA